VQLVAAFSSKSRWILLYLCLCSCLYMSLLCPVGGHVDISISISILKSISGRLSANQRALYAYVNDVLTEQKHNHKKKNACLCLCRGRPHKSISFLCLCLCLCLRSGLSACTGYIPGIYFIEQLKHWEYSSKKERK